MDRDNQMDNPCSSWLPDLAWDNVTELDKLTNFHGAITSFEQYTRDWNVWFTSPEPENTSLPGTTVSNKTLHFLVLQSQTKYFTSGYYSLCSPVIF